MAWNPETYNKFKSDRTIPFFDAMKLIVSKPQMEVLDLGCGTGELTAKLAETLDHPKQVLGIDASAAMLKDSKSFENEILSFECKSIEKQLDSGKKWDLIFSNAAIQWVGNHEIVLPKIISNLKPGGQMVIQMPSQTQNIANILLNQLAEQRPFGSVLNHWKRTSAVLNTDAYAKILFENGSRKMTVFEKIYPLILENFEAVYDFVSGSALIPYLEKLPPEMHETFNDAFKKELKLQFPGSPAFYPFKRIIFEAQF